MNYTEQVLKENIGKVIKLERARRGLTQESLAAKIGVEPKTLSKVETGVIFISASLLSKLANFFQMHPNEFFKFGFTAEVKDDKDKMLAIGQMLEFVDSKTLDIVYKMIKSLS